MQYTNLKNLNNLYFESFFKAYLKFRAVKLTLELLVANRRLAYHPLIEKSTVCVRKEY